MPGKPYLGGVVNIKRRVMGLLALFFIIAFVSGTAWIIREKEEKKPLHYLRKNNWAQITEDVFVFSGDGSENMTLIISGKDATIIDTGAMPWDSDVKRGVNKLMETIEKKKLRVKNIIYTHYDRDHTSNTALFTRNEPRGSVNMYCPYSTEYGQLIKMGDKTFRVIDTYGHAAICGGHISIELVKENILVSGDVLYTNFIPCMRPGDSPKAYIETLEKIKKAKYAMIIPGHGNILNPDYTVERSLKYLYTLKKKSEKMLRDGASLADLRRSIKLKDCFKDAEGVNLQDSIQTEFHRSNIRQFYAELKGEPI